MTKPIRIEISGAYHRDADAPTAESLLVQIQDFVSALRVAVDFSYEASLINLSVASDAEHKLATKKQPHQDSHTELGSLEGFISKVEFDRDGHPLVWLKSRLDGEMVKCIFDNDALDRIGHFELSEVLKGLRVRVHGLLKYKTSERITSIEVESIQTFDADDDLPHHTEIVSPNFTNGVEASEYLKRLHSDG